MEHKPVYPFSALVGQNLMKKGLLLNAINPRICGILIRGEKGTAKSTAVRALARVLPAIKVVADCPFSCDPANILAMCHCCRARIAMGEKLPVVERLVSVFTLPIGATEDMVVGSIDFERAVSGGVKRFQPGLLARANRGIVYVDEVNLLDDHIVDVLLDSAASGVNVVEREGISYVHPADFILVGTMNPEEGEIRPQLLDRFGLCVNIDGLSDTSERLLVIKRREKFDENPELFVREWEPEQAVLKEKIREARNILPSVGMPENLLGLITEIALGNFVAGHRTDILMEKVAKANAAFDGREEVIVGDVKIAATLVLLHRKQNPPQVQQAPEREESKDEHEEQDHQDQDDARQDQDDDQDENKDEDSSNEPPVELPLEMFLDPEMLKGISQEDTVFNVGTPFPVKHFEVERDRKLRRGSGRRSRTRTASRSGRYVKSTLIRRSNDLALDATLRAAAPYQSLRRERNQGRQMAVLIEEHDIREKIREKRIGNFLVFVVDASGSMGAKERMVETKGAIFSLLLDAYQKRDRVAMIAFRRSKAELVLPPTNSIEMAHTLLKELPTGGKTPLSDALIMAYEMIHVYRMKDPYTKSILILITDGRANVALGQEKAHIESLNIAGRMGEEDEFCSIVIDTEEQGIMSFGLARKIACALGAQYHHIEGLKSAKILDLVKKEMNGDHV